ncbi:MAG: hypothetical protein R3F34_10990 [Planctomycetota bacterium]
MRREAESAAPSVAAVALAAPRTSSPVPFAAADAGFAAVHADLSAESPFGDEALEVEPYQVLGVWMSGVDRFRYRRGVLTALDASGRVLAEGGWRLAPAESAADRVRGGIPDGVWHHFDPSSGRIVLVETFVRGTCTESRAGSLGAN